jgi:hypothetical protein
VLTVSLGLGTLWACGRKAPPSLPEGERLKITQEGGGQSLSVYSPFEEKAPPGKEKTKGHEQAKQPGAPPPHPSGEAAPPPNPSNEAAPRPAPPEDVAPGPGVEPPLTDEGVSPMDDQGLPPSPGGPGEGGF